MRLYLKDNRLYTFFLAILPVIMMYRFPLVGMGMSTVLIAGTMVFAGIVFLSQLKDFSEIYLITFILYFVYAITKSDGSTILLCIAILVHFLAISLGAIDVQYLRKIIENIALIASIAVILQFCYHTLSGNHIPMINIDWCLSEMEQYRSSILTGIGRTEAIYRPSAFFLEPSHLANYASVAIVSCLLMGDPKYIKAAVISLGVICTTSGMGIVMVGGIWAIFPFIATKKIDNTKVKRIMVLAGLFLITLAVLSQMSFFQNALNRITGSTEYSSSQYNAIWGRTLYWKIYITPMTGNDLLFGYGSASLPDVYFTGLMRVIYSYGVTGVGLLYLSLLTLLIKSKNNGCKLLVLLYGGLLPFANLTGFITMIFYLGSIMALHHYTSEALNEMKLGKRVVRHHG